MRKIQTALGFLSIFISLIAGAVVVRAVGSAGLTAISASLAATAEQTAVAAVLADRAIARRRATATTAAAAAITARAAAAGCGGQRVLEQGFERRVAVQTHLLDGLEILQIGGDQSGAGAACHRRDAGRARFRPFGLLPVGVHGRL